MSASGPGASQPGRCIVPLGGGFGARQDDPRMARFLLALSPRPRPRICFVPTASGDADSNIAWFYDVFGSDRCEPAHLRLFHRRIQDLREFVLRQDIVYVGGGATAYMLDIWRRAGLDEILRDAWARGVALCGVSAGGLCWFEAGLTDSYGRPLQALTDGLGFLSGSYCPHYDGETDRRAAFHQAIADGAIPPGIAADDGVALVYRGTALAEIVSSRPEARAWQVARTDGVVRETALIPRRLTDD